jgi:hypothetical protein
VPRTNPAQTVVDDALREVIAGYSRVRKNKAPQVRSAEERDNLKSLAYAWFQSHKPQLTIVSGIDLNAVDEQYSRMLEASGRASARTTCLAALKGAKESLLQLRLQVAQASPSTPAAAPAAPDFSALASDVAMKAILGRRWAECEICVKAGADLAATVMMGGLLEALFVSRANKMSDKSKLFALKSTPLDKAGKPVPLQDWTLQPYIDVGHEMGWIRKSAKDVAIVLRDYRNYVHPEKELRHGVTLTPEDSRMFWEVSKQLASQLLKSVR